MPLRGDVALDVYGCSTVDLDDRIARWVAQGLPLKALAITMTQELSMWIQFHHDSRILRRSCNQIEYVLYRIKS